MTACMVVHLPTAAPAPVPNRPRRAGRPPKVVIANWKLERARSLRELTERKKAGAAFSGELKLATLILLQPHNACLLSPGTLSEIKAIHSEQDRLRKLSEGEQP